MWNYPDDIQSYNNDPRSPLFEGEETEPPLCPACAAETTHLQDSTFYCENCDVTVEEK